MSANTSKIFLMLVLGFAAFGVSFAVSRLLVRPGDAPPDQVTKAPPSGSDPGADRPGMVWISGGEFRMGTGDKDAWDDEKPIHRVRVDGFWIDVTEVTNAQFQKFVEATSYITTAEKVPSVSFISTGPGTQLFVMRGVSDGSNPTYSNASATGFFVDDLSMSWSGQQPDLHLPQRLHVESRQHHIEMQFPQPFIVHAPGHLGPPVEEAGEEGDHHRPHHHVVEMGHHEARGRKGGGQAPHMTGQQLQEQHDVRVLLLQGAQAVPVSAEFLSAVTQATTAGDSAQPTAVQQSFFTQFVEATDLSTPLQTAGQAKTGGKSVAVLLTDGRHTQGPSPVESARELAAAGTRVVTVSIGAAEEPPDLAILKLEHPDSVFRRDQVRGVVLLQDRGPVGAPFVLQIRHQNEVLWQRQETSTGAGERRVEFSIK